MKLANSLIVIALIGLCGCTTWMRAYVAIHDAADKALATSTNHPAVVTPSPVTNPASVTPAATGALVVPLAYLGDEATVDGILSRGELPESDNRSPYKFQLLRPDGKSWSFANFVESGLVREGKVHAGLFHDQHYTPVYQSEHDQGVHMAGHALKDGDILGAERFIYFECRNKQ